MNGMCHLQYKLRVNGTTVWQYPLFIKFPITRKLNDKNTEIKWNVNLMQLGNFIDVFLVRHVSGTYAHHQEH